MVRCENHGKKKQARCENNEKQQAMCENNEKKN
jgi:hypothetical protein